MRRVHRLPRYLLTLCLPACFSDPPIVGDIESGGRETEGEETEGHGTDGPSTDGPSTDTNDTDSSGDPVCGDGVVEGDEVCDDGVNDGSYGGCLEDCSGPAGYCGDGVVNGPEVCDDGINDDSYDGCAPDCASLGPHCGDGIVQEPEMCDEGENNENGTGCNVDCVTSGTLLETWESDPLDFCSGTARVAPPVFREDGNVLVAGGGHCEEGDRILLEFSPALELLESDVLVVGSVPTDATMIGSDWILSAWRCNYVVAENGSFAEVCGDDWLAGASRIEPLDEDGYLTVDPGGHVARHPAGNPAQGHDPTWSVTQPGSGNPLDRYFDATFGDEGNVVIAGYRRTGTTSFTYEGYVRSLTATGNSAGSWTYAEIEGIYGFRRTADGGYVGWRGISSEGEVALVKLSPAFDLEWTAEQFHRIRDVQVDAAAHIIVAHQGSGTPNNHVAKLTASGDELWSLDVTSGFQGRLGIDASDTIFRATPTHDDTVLVQKISP